MTLPCHVTADGNQHRRTEGIFVRAQHCCNQNITRRLQAAIAAQTHAATQTFSQERLLRLRKTQLPGIASVLDAGQR